MIKKMRTIIVMLCLVLGVFVPMTDQAESDYVYDLADLLTTEEEDEL